MQDNAIQVYGARENNLRVDQLSIPREKITVVTGLSGSGKSSLAYNTIYAEGQRKFIESLSVYARQYIFNMKRPEVELIEGLSPTISIDQRSRSDNPRSTVGTQTEIYDYLRLLYATVGVPHCTKCDREIRAQSINEIEQNLENLPHGSKWILLSPVVESKKGEFSKEFERIKKMGFEQALVDGALYQFSALPSLSRYKMHSIDVVIDKWIIKDFDARMRESLDLAIKIGNGSIKLVPFIEKKAQVEGARVFSTKRACPDCVISFPALEPRSFSFNSPLGACKACNGLGWRQVVDIDSLLQRYMEHSIIEVMQTLFSSILDISVRKITNDVCKHYNINPKSLLSEVSPDFVQKMFNGSSDEIKFGIKGRDSFFEQAFPGFIKLAEAIFEGEKQSKHRKEFLKLLTSYPCESCQTSRLRPESRSVHVGGHTIDFFTKLPIEKCMQELKKISFKTREKKIAGPIINEITERLSFLIQIGLNYLTLDRPSASLSGGESQRIRLSTQLGTSLIGVMYILDEPSIGLHQADTHKLIKSLEKLRDNGNTLIVVEHDESIISNADHIVDLGPGGGKGGGEIVALGDVDSIKRNRSSMTGMFLAGIRSIDVPSKRRKGEQGEVVIKKARYNNLKDIDVALPLKKLIGITGVSGSGKSSLILDTLIPEFERKRSGLVTDQRKCDDIIGIDAIKSLYHVDQSPIGRTPRSTPATYTGVFGTIRTLFAGLPESRLRGYKPGQFSFNVEGGRCEACQGDGTVKIEMHFLPDVFVPCDVCQGRRYGPQTLQVFYKGKNIYDILSMTVDEATEFFRPVPAVFPFLEVMQEIGLGYLTLGQPSTTLSGGESQRLKLTRELAKGRGGDTFYILDEPTTGLHFEDIRKLMSTLNRLVDKGNTVLVIEHNMDVIKCCDHIIDLGPYGGEEGGEVIAQGTPEGLAESKKSLTGKYLRKYL